MGLLLTIARLFDMYVVISSYGCQLTSLLVWRQGYKWLNHTTSYVTSLQKGYDLGLLIRDHSLIIGGGGK